MKRGLRVAVISRCRSSRIFFVDSDISKNSNILKFEFEIWVVGNFCKLHFLVLVLLIKNMCNLDNQIAYEFLGKF